RANAVALVERNSNAELTIIARDDRRALAEAGIDYCLDIRLALDVRELRGHVAVARPIGFFMHDGDFVFRGNLHALVAHRFSEGTGTRNDSDLRYFTLVHVGEDLLARHRVGVRSLEHPLFH